MAGQSCPNCGKSYQPGDEACRHCGFVFPFSTSILPPGTLLRSRYEIQQLIHYGGMGFIYLAKDKNLFDRLCVVKQVRDRIQSKEHQAKLEEEALRMSRLHHQNVAMILDHFVEADHYFLVVEHIRGKTLSEVLQERHGTIGESEVLRWAVTICDVITYLHAEGIIHRDISPDNLMLTPQGVIKFIDFGTLRELQNVRAGGTAGMGKFGFTPPEQWNGTPEPRSDIFALGATVYYLLSGYLPLSAEYRSGQSPQKADFNPDFPPVRAKNPAVSPELEAILKKALQLDLNHRYSTAAEIKRDIDILLTGKTRRSQQGLKNREKAKPRVYIVVASIVLILGAIGVGVNYLVSQAGGKQAGVVNVYPGSSINVAISKADPGGTVIVHAGTYKEAVLVPSNKTGIVLKGEPGTVLDGTGLDSGDGVTVLRVNDVTIDGFEIRNFFNFGIFVNGSNNIKITGSNVHNNFQSGIEVGDGDFNEIVGNTVSNSSHNGITLWTSNSNLVEKNTVQDNADYGILVINNCNGATIKDNQVINSGLSAILLHDSNENRIEQNMIEKCGEYGISLSITTAGANCDDNTILNNTVKNSNYPGIFVGESHRNLIEGNIVSRNGLAGIQVTKSQSNRVIGNEVSGSSGGILIDVSNQSVVSGNRLTDSHDFGIKILASNNNQIEDNTILGIAGSGILVVSNSNDNTISSNSVSDSTNWDLEWDKTGAGNRWEKNAYFTSNLPPAIVSPPATVAPAATPAPTVPPATGPQVLRLNMNTGEPATIDPARASWESEITVIKQCFQGLLGYTEGLALKPVVAKEIPSVENGGISADGKIYTFRLRQNVTWSDGKKLTAGDFAYSLKRMLSPDISGPYASFYFNIVGGEAYFIAGGKSAAEKAALRDQVGVIAIDDYTLEIRLKSIQPAFLQLMALSPTFPVRQDIIEKYSDKWTEPPNYTGNGPCVLSEWVHSVSIKLVRNTNYWGFAPNLTQIDFSMIADPNVALDTLKNGGLDIVPVPAGMEKSTKQTMGSQILIENDLITYGFRFNVSRAPFDNKLVRQAIATAIDRATFIDFLRGGVGQVALSWLPPGMPGYDASAGSEFSFDPVRAKSLLAQAGYPGGQGLPSITFSHSSSGINPTIAQFLQTQMKNNLGIDIILEPLDAKTLTTKLNSRQYQWCFTGWGMDYPDPENSLPGMFMTGADNNLSTYSNSQFDDLAGKAAVELDEAKRRQLWIEAQKLMVADCPVIPVYYRQRFFLVQPWVKGLKTTGMDGMVPGWLFLNDVYLQR